MNGKHEIIEQLRRDIRSLETNRSCTVRQPSQVELGPINQAFQDKRFPLGAMHEFRCNEMKNLAATQGFIAAILGYLLKDGTAGVWIGPVKTMLPTALLHYGIKPDHVFFVDASSDKEVLYIMEELLKCPDFVAVVGQLRDLDLTASRRLQIALKQSHVTGFIIRYQPRRQQATSSYCKWQITTLPGFKEPDRPGVGAFHWQVKLEKTLYGRPGSWTMAWKRKHFVSTQSPATYAPSVHRKAG